MSHLRSVSRRALAVATSVFVGLVGAVALASPAQAHHTYVNGEAECPDPDTGEWVVTWTVTSWKPHGDQPSGYKITQLTPGPDGTEVTGIPTGEFRDIDEAFVGQQTLPADATTATLEVKAKWNNGSTKTNHGTVERPEPCEVPEPPAPVGAEATSTCDGLDVSVTNPEDGEEVDVTLTPSTGEPVTETLTPGEAAERSFTADGDELTVAVTIGDDVVESFAWTRPEDCDEETDEPENGTGGGDDEELPVTGLQSGLVIGGALLMLALGAGLFLVARKRRIAFTA